MSYLFRPLGRDGNSQLDIDARQFAAGVRVRPVNAIGHYRTNHRFAILPAQVANARLFQIRNKGTNLIVITRLVIKWLQTAAHTAAIEDSLDVYKLTGFTAVDTTSTVTPAASVKKGTMGAAPGNVDIRGIQVAGLAAGMTGGTLVKDAVSIGQLPKWLLLAQPTAGPVEPSVMDTFDDVNGTHPFVFAQNEGFGIENRVLLGAAAGSSVYVDCSYAECTTAEWLGA